MPRMDGQICQGRPPPERKLTAVAGLPCALKRLVCGVCVILMLCITAPLHTSSAATDIDLVLTEEPEGYARFILTFDDMPSYEVEVVSGVLVLSFEEEMSARLDQTTLRAPDYVIVGRVDPSGLALRFALGRDIRVNTLEAGNQLFIDLLPTGWTGMMPGLPRAVIAELARRAEEAEETAREEARQRELENSQNVLAIRVGQHPTFSRIVFDWESAVATTLSRNGDTISVGFDQLAVVPLERLKVDPPRFILSARHLLTDSGMSVEIVIEPGSGVRGFKEENSYVVDILAPEGVTESENLPVTNLLPEAGDVPMDAEEEIQFSSPTVSPTAPPAASEAEIPVALSTEESGLQTADADELPAAEVPLPVEQIDTALAPAVDLAETASDLLNGEGGEEYHEELPDVIVSEFYLNDNGTGLSSETDEMVAENGNSAPASTPDTSIAEAADDRPDDADSVAMDDGAQENTVAEVVPEVVPGSPVEVHLTRTGHTLQVSFPFGERVSSAVFRRADTLWAVFDTGRPLDLAAFSTHSGDHFKDYDLIQSGELQILKLALTGYALASASSEDTTWILNLAETIITPAAPVSLNRGLRSDGRAKITVDYPGLGLVHRLRDAEIGDQITVVTGFGPQRGIIQSQEFVEFSALQSAHGLVVKPNTDDLMVRLLEDEVLITRTGGLTLSSGALSHLDDTDGAALDASRPGFIDYESWVVTDSSFFAQAGALQSSIMNLEPSQTLRTRLDLTRLFLANDLGAEALGQLTLIGEFDPSLISDPMFAVMRGIANVLMHRPAEAREDLNGLGLADDPHTALWRGVMETQAHNWREALEEFKNGENIIVDYPETQQAMFRLAAARAALEANDFAIADLQLKSMPREGLSASMTADLEVLQGRLFVGLERHAEALDLFAAARNSGDRKAEAEAIYHSVILQSELGTISPQDAAAELEGLSMIWRGDDLELKTLRLVAEHHIDDQDYRRGLEVMKTAVTTYPDATLALEIHDEMTALFEDLYLNNTADIMRPVDALALYYEFRELTPVGRKGDEMIRNLADRLIAVDLLDQAADILTHQVDKRLIGAARAQVAAKLAMVHLMNREPSDALQVIRQTRQATLPQHIQTYRRLIEARALTELGQIEAAIDLLVNEDGEEALQQRAEAHWRGENWQAAGETFEKLLGSRLASDEALSASERMNVLRAAISYAFADDRLGAERLRGQFLELMQDTPDANAFDVVTGRVNKDGVAFRNLANQIAALDTLEAFLVEFRQVLEGPIVGADASGL